jgi:hypothetical protein
MTASMPGILCCGDRRIFGFAVLLRAGKGGGGLSVLRSGRLTAFETETGVLAFDVDPGVLEMGLRKGILSEVRGLGVCSVLQGLTVPRGGSLGTVEISFNIFSDDTACRRMGSRGGNGGGT